MIIPGSCRWDAKALMPRTDVDLPVPDYYVDFHVGKDDGAVNEELTVLFDEYFKASFYKHSVDPSHRVMFVDFSKLEEFHQLLLQQRSRLMIEINGMSACASVSYGPQRFEVYDPQKEYKISFLHPNTTTLIDLVLNRQQMDRMLVIKGSDLQPLARVLVTTAEVPQFHGRAELIRNSQDLGSDDLGSRGD